MDASSDSKVYDGERLYSPDNNYTLTFYKDNDAENKDVDNVVMGEGNVLVSGHSFVLTTPYALNVRDGDFEDGQYLGVKNNPYVGVKSGSEDVTKNYAIIWNSGRLTITPRPVAYTVQEYYEMDYCNAGPTLTYSVQREDAANKQGVLNSEWSSFNFKLKYVDQMGNTITRFNAGTYTVSLADPENPQAHNYSFVTEKMGTLVINQVNLSIKLPEIYEEYTDPNQVIRVSVSDWRKWLKDGLIVGLVEGDEIATFELNRTDLMAIDNKSSATLKISKGSVVIWDVYTHETTDYYDGNYIISLEAGVIGFYLRTVYYEQILPPEIQIDPLTGRGVLPYTGERYVIEDNGNLYRILGVGEAMSIDPSINAGMYGFIGTDNAELKRAQVSKDVGIYERWVELDIYNSAGYKLSRLYNVVLVTSDATSIEVRAQTVTLDLSPLNSSMWESAGAGVTVLDVYVEAQGLLADHELAVAVLKDESGNVVSIYIFIFTPRYKDGAIYSLSDKSYIYQLDYTGTTLPVKLVDASKYPLA